MRYIFIFVLVFCTGFASKLQLNSFDADFVQNITDDKNKTLLYSGHIVATKPQSALWNYTKPIKKDIYISEYSVTIIEPEIEQVIIRRISSNFDIFHLIKNAKEIQKNRYLTTYKNTKFHITIQNGMIESISYKDEFDNNVEIIFTNQKQNIRHCRVFS